LKGDTAKAKAAYRDFLVLWKDADPDDEDGNAAKAEEPKVKQVKTFLGSVACAFLPNSFHAPLETSLRPSTSFILRFKRLCLSLEKNLDSICSPHRDASTEKIRIFGPHCACQSECCGEYWPITFDNNAVERALRTVALGRKNLLFCGSDAGGERAAAMDSLLESVT
jgi:Transposase IS66 family